MNAVIPLNRYLTEAPENQFFNLKCKAVALHTLEIISYVALVAIMTAIFTISYGGVVLAGAASLGMVGIVLSAVAIGAAAPCLSKVAADFSARAEAERQTLLELKDIKHWKTPEIEHFMQAQGLSSENARVHLQQLDGEEPLCPLLPVIAKFKSLEKLAAKVQAVAAENFQAAQEASANQTSMGKRIRIEGYKIAWDKYQEALPIAMNAAMMLQIIQQPWNIALDCVQPNGTLPLIGRCKNKTFTENLYDLCYEPNDDYFIFNEDLRHPVPLRRTELLENMAPYSIRDKLFGIA